MTPTTAEIRELLWEVRECVCDACEMKVDDLLARLDAPAPGGWLDDPAIAHQRAEERLCSCGASGSGEEHEEECPWQNSPWKSWGDAVSGEARVRELLDAQPYQNTVVTVAQVQEALAAPQPEAKPCPTCRGSRTVYGTETMGLASQPCPDCTGRAPQPEATPHRPGVDPEPSDTGGNAQSPGRAPAPPDADVGRAFTLWWGKYTSDDDSRLVLDAFTGGYRAAIAALGQRSELDRITKAITQIEGYLTEPTASAKVGRGHLRGWLYLFRALAGEPG